jgi:hypothetical protein
MIEDKMTDEEFRQAMLALEEVWKVWPKDQLICECCGQKIHTMCPHVWCEGDKDYVGD